MLCIPSHLSNPFDTGRITFRELILFCTGSSLLCTSSSLDAIGLAGFSHNFGSLEGRTSPVSTVLDGIGSSPRSKLNAGFFALSQVLPALVHYPTKRTMLIQELPQELSKIFMELLNRTKKEKEAGIADENMDKSVIGLLRMHSFIGPITPLTIRGLS